VSRRRLRIAALVACSTTRASIAFALAWPSTMTVAGLLGEQPDGDLLLWESGGVWLLDVARRFSRSYETLPTTFVSTLVFALVLGSLPLSALIASHAAEVPTSWRGLGSTVLRSLARLTLISSIELVIRAVSVAFLGAFVGFALRPFVGVAVETRPFLIGTLLGTAFATVVGVLGDLARVRVVWRDVSTSAALSSAVHWLRRDWRPLLAAALLRLGVSVGGVLLAVRLVVTLAPGVPRSALAAALVTGVVPVLARNAWLARVAASHERSGEAPTTST
jgi:hypothetical protein